MSSSSSSSASYAPAAGLYEIRDRKKECKVTVRKVYLEDLDPELIERRKLKVVIKDIRLEDKK